MWGKDRGNWDRAQVMGVCEELNCNILIPNPYKV